MIELTPEQREQLGAGRVVNVTDTQTAEAYVVLSKESYKSLLGFAYDGSDWTHEEMRANLAYDADTSWDGPYDHLYDRYDEARAKR